MTRTTASGATLLLLPSPARLDRASLGSFIMVWHVAKCGDAPTENQDVRQAHRLQQRLLTSLFFRFFTGSGVSSSGDAAMPAARFLALIMTVGSGGKRYGTVSGTQCG